MPVVPSTDHRRAIAERNVVAILDAAEGLLTAGAPSSMSAVAAAAGVSRVTLYAHFPTREALVEGVTARVIAGAKAALEDARLDEGPALDALDRLIEIGWRHLDRGGAIARTVADVLTPAARDRAHAALHEPIGALIRRGQASGEFRDDLSVGWLLATYFALMHAAGDQMRAGALASEDAVGVLQPTLRSVFAAPRRGRR